MTVQIPNPPDLTGDNTRDLESLYQWCMLLNSKLRLILYNLDSANITSLSADRIFEE